MEAFSAFAFGHVQALFDPAHADLADHDVVLRFDGSDPRPRSRQLLDHRMGFRLVRILYYRLPTHDQPILEQNGKGILHSDVISLSLDLNTPFVKPLWV